MMMFLLLKHTLLLEEGVFLCGKVKTVVQKKKEKQRKTLNISQKEKKETRGHSRKKVVLKSLS